jgi:hypothetical protein
MAPHARSRTTLLTLLTATCLAGAAALGVLSPRPAHAQAGVEGCANGGCQGTYCRYMPSFSCSFPDQNTCTTSKCVFVLPY